MRFDPNPQETRSTLEVLAKECRDRNGILQKPTADPDVLRCFSAPLEQRFCPYQDGTVKIQEMQHHVPFPATVEYYRCTYNRGD